MMKQLAVQMKWQFLILHKNNLINVSIALTVVYGLIFWGLKDLGDLSKILTLLIFNDPALIGLLFVGLAYIMEKNQGVTYALRVLPVHFHTQLLARMFSLSIIGMLCAFGMAVPVMLLNFNIPVFLMGVLGICLIFSCIGIWVLSYSSEFLVFMLKCIPFLLICSLIFLNYFGVTDIWLFNLLPVNSSLKLISHSFTPELSSPEIILHSVISLAWFIALYFISSRTFKTRFLGATH